MHDGGQGPEMQRIISTATTSRFPLRKEVYKRRQLSTGNKTLVNDALTKSVLVYSSHLEPTESGVAPHHRDRVLQGIHDGCWLQGQQQRPPYYSQRHCARQ
eukprot:1003472-Pyramimonas_sp.AAC.1